MNARVVRWVVAAVAVAVAAATALIFTCRGTSSPSGPHGHVGTFTALVDPDLQLLVTPSAAGHQPFVRAIDGAHATIDMTMFHLTDLQVVDALVRAAGRGIHVRVIVDRKGVTAKANQRAFDALRAGGVEARTSSAGFSLTHAKAMVVDDDVAFVTAINLTRDADRTRDLGVVTHARAIVGDVAALFAADWHNAETGGRDTPAMREDSLVVSPVSSRARLIALIASADRELLVTVENLGDPRIDDAIVAAVQHGVAVRVLVPLCDKNPNPLFNVPAAQLLAAAGATVRMMPSPETATQPYMHSKMILADGATAYVGSVNFSVSSTTRSRELGIIFMQPAATAEIRSLFETDWAHGIAPPTAVTGSCSALGAADATAN